MLRSTSGMVPQRPLSPKREKSSGAYAWTQFMSRICEKRESGVSGAFENERAMSWPTSHFVKAGPRAAVLARPVRKCPAGRHERQTEATPHKPGAIHGTAAM